jgi:class 3 adenylate cyclase
LGDLVLTDESTEEKLRLQRTHFSCRVYRPYLVYLRRHHPEIDLEDLVRSCGLSLRYLEQEERFVSTIFDARFTKACIEKTGNPKLCFEVGAQSLSEEVLGKFVNLLVTNTLSTAGLFSKLSALTAVYSKVTRVDQLKEMGPNGELVFNFSPVIDGLHPDELQALADNWDNIVANTMGHYASIPASQGFRPADVRVMRIGELSSIPIYKILIAYEGGNWLGSWIPLLVASLLTFGVVWLGSYANILADFGFAGLIAGLIVSIWIAAGHRQFRTLKEKFDSAIKAADLSSRAHAEALKANEQVLKLASVYKRFVPEKVLQELGVSNLASLKHGDSHRGTYAVAFIDIRGFSRLAELAPADLVFRTLNVYLGAIAPIIEAHKGWIDNIMGDGVFAIFPEGAHSAYRCSSEILHHVEDMQGGGLFGSFELKIGVGISQGDMILGTLGYSERMQATVISDTVNLAARFEKMAKHLGCALVVDEPTFLLLGTEMKAGFEDLGTHLIEGRSHPVTLYGVKNDRLSALRPTFKKLGRSS